MSKLGDGAKDIFSRDKASKPSKQKNSEPQADRPRKAGRPKVHTDEVLKTVLTIKKDQLIWLDQLSLDVRASYGSIIDRGLLIRAFISAVMESGLDFGKIENEEDAKDILMKKLKRK